MKRTRGLIQNQRTAIVTGGSQGIGAAISRRLAADGFAVVVNFLGATDKAEAQVAQIRAAGGRATAVQADVSDADLMEGLFDQAEAAFGSIDVLVNNAGIMRLSSLADAPDSDFDQQVAVNLKGVFNGMREAAKRLRRGGRIISISSSVVGLHQPTYGIYVATKAGIEAMTRVLACEMHERSITVNAVAPGPVATEGPLERVAKDAITHPEGLSPPGRPGQPDDIASVVSFLAGPQAGWVNGQVLRANGGIV